MKKAPLLILTVAIALLVCAAGFLPTTHFQRIVTDTFLGRLEDGVILPTTNQVIHLNPTNGTVITDSDSGGFILWQDDILKLNKIWTLQAITNDGYFVSSQLSLGAPAGQAVFHVPIYGEGLGLFNLQLFGATNGVNVGTVPQTNIDLWAGPGIAISGTNRNGHIDFNISSIAAGGWTGNPNQFTSGGGTTNIKEFAFVTNFIIAGQTYFNNTNSFVSPAGRLQDDDQSVTIGADSNTNSGRADFTAIVGGRNNKISATVSDAGGIFGSASSIISGSGIILGGFANEIRGADDVIATGQNNFTASGSSHSFIAAGYSNYSGGLHVVALGDAARSTNSGCFVFADYLGTGHTPFFTTRTNQFIVRALNGVGINTNNPTGYGLAVAGNAYVMGNSIVAGGTFVGDGSYLTNLYATNQTAFLVANSTVGDGSIRIYGSLDGNYGTIGRGDGTITFDKNIVGDGSEITDLNANSLSSGIVPGARLTDTAITNATYSGGTRFSNVTNNGTYVQSGGDLHTNYATGNWLRYTNGVLTIGPTNASANITVNGVTGVFTNTGLHVNTTANEALRLNGSQSYINFSGGNDTGRIYVNRATGNFWGAIGNAGGRLTLGHASTAGATVTNTLYIDESRNVTVAGYLAPTNGVVLYQLVAIPTNAIPPSSSALTNWVHMNLTNRGPCWVMTNYTTAGSFIIRQPTFTDSISGP